jgi:hypothetical protein
MTSLPSPELVVVLVASANEAQVRTIELRFESLPATIPHVGYPVAELLEVTFTDQLGITRSYSLAVPGQRVEVEAEVEVARCPLAFRLLTPVPL